MAFSPQFLDEVRARVPIADVVGRRVKLLRRGREHTGLCPFHNEKTPSFTVSEQKGFFHCFGCGAHGDVIGFVMRAEGLPFPEAVERLAGEAGLEVPQATPAERAQAQKAKGLLEVVEAACKWFEGNLTTAAGTEARAYFTARGIDETTIARFRLGFAPDRRDGVRVALMGQGITEDQLLEAGLISRPDDGRPTYDRFRGRVIFPITDRRGRVIAFGGRLLAEREGVAKYLNSPETPLFSKGRLLYALDKAAAVRGEAEIVVTEGYTDVIALHRAGFPGAVAPLGTALTEAQIGLLWRLAPEPILCFDGDAAGQRAAARAAERALPLLKPGYSLRFALLPAGEDPDSLIRGLGVEAMRRILTDARPLVDVVWSLETSGPPADTPERRAKIRENLRRRAYEIADRTVQDYYLSEFDARLSHAFSRNRAGPGGGPRGGKQRDWRGRRDGRPEKAGFVADFGGGGFGSGLKTDGNVDVLRLRQQQLLLVTVINYPEIMDEVGEALGSLLLADVELDKLRQEIIKTLDSGLDSKGLQGHLIREGYSDLLDRLLCGDVYGHGSFARPGGNSEPARQGWQQLFDRFYHRRQYGVEIDAAARAFAEEPSDQNRAYLDRLREQQLSTNESDWGDGDPDGAIEGWSPDG